MQMKEDSADPAKGVFLWETVQHASDQRLPTHHISGTSQRARFAPHVIGADALRFTVSL